MLREAIELVKGASHSFDRNAYLAGKLTPVFFGSAINNFGVRELLDDFANMRQHRSHVKPKNAWFTLMKNNLPVLCLKSKPIWILTHRDRIAFLRVCSGHFEKGYALNIIA